VLECIEEKIDSEGESKSTKFKWVQFLSPPLSA